MLYTYLYQYHTHLSFLNVLRYPSFRITMAALTALLITLILFPPLIKKLQMFKFGQVVRKVGPEAHFAKKGTPTMGGILILFAVGISSILWADVSNIGVWLLMLVMFGYGAIGFYDDYVKVKRNDPDGLGGRYKLLWQLIIGGAAIYIYSLNFDSLPFTTDLTVPFISIAKFNPVLPTWIYIVFALFILLATSNSANLSDGLDGLAIGPIMISAFVFLILAYAAGTTLADFNIAAYLKIPSIKGAEELSVVCAAIVGAGIGFLWYNAYPALIFMGDVGSLALGGVLGLLAIFTKNELLSGILHGVFVVEAISVIIQVLYFKKTRKRFFKMAPIHHHFELSGWPEPRVIVRFWIVSVMLAMVALISLKLR